MSLRFLIILSLIIAVLAGWYYRQQDDMSASLSLSTSNIDYQATHIDALQTNAQGKAEYMLTANQLTHFTDRNEDELQQLSLHWQPKEQQTIQLNAAFANIYHTTGDVIMRDNVVMRNYIQTPVQDIQNGGQELAKSPSTPITLTASQLLGNFKQNTLQSKQPVQVQQGQHTFRANSFQADLQTGEYEFEHISTTFVPIKRQDKPLF